MPTRTKIIATLPVVHPGYADRSKLILAPPQCAIDNASFAAAATAAATAAAAVAAFAAAAAAAAADSAILSRKMHQPTQRAIF